MDKTFKIALLMLFFILLLTGIYIGYWLGRKKAKTGSEQYGLSYREYMMSMDSEDDEIIGISKINPESSGLDNSEVIDYKSRELKADDIIKSELFKINSSSDKSVSRNVTLKTNKKIFQQKPGPVSVERKKEYFKGIEE